MGQTDKDTNIRTTLDKAPDDVPFLKVTYAFDLAILLVNTCNSLVFLLPLLVSLKV